MLSISLQRKPPAPSKGDTPKHFRAVERLLDGSGLSVAVIPQA